MSMSEYELSLVADAKKGKKKALDRLHDALHKTLCGVIEQELGDRSRAETILRAVFERLKVRVKSVTDPAQFEDMAIQETISECKNYPKSDKPAESGATQFATYESAKKKQEAETPKAPEPVREQPIQPPVVQPVQPPVVQPVQPSVVQPAYNEPANRYSKPAEELPVNRPASNYDPSRSAPRYTPPVQQPVRRPAVQPARKDPVQRYARPVEDIPVGRPAQQSPQRPAQQFAQKYVPRSSGQQAQRPSQDTARQPVQQTPKRPAQQFAQQYVPRPAGQQVQRPAERPAGRPQQPVHQPAPNPPVAEMNNKFEEPVMGWLVCVNGFDRDRNYAIKDKVNVIGSSPESDIRIHREPAVLPENHASIVYDKANAQCTLQIGSGDNVRLNGQYITGSQVLKKFDIITIGNTQLVYAPFSEGLGWKRNFGL